VGFNKDLGVAELPIGETCNLTICTVEKMKEKERKGEKWQIPGSNSAKRDELVRGQAMKPNLHAATAALDDFKLWESK